MRELAEFYLGYMKIAALQQFQYRVSNYFYMIGMIAEPVVYLVVWQTVARDHGGALAGFTEGEIAAYYIIWTLVKNMNVVLTPMAWDGRIRNGQLAEMLLRPIHPLHIDIAYFVGWKIVAIVLWLPIAAFLAWVFRPTIALSLGSVIAFFIVIWGGFLVRFMLGWLIGLASFWTTRVSAILELWMVGELLLSGRLVPLEFLPDWAQFIANLLPFKWAFGFPIEVLMGKWSATGILYGIAMQLVWILIVLGISSILWRSALQRFTSVGG